METNRLKQFCTLVETGNLRKTAELTHISHSGLSKSLHALEREIGLKLFLPQGRGIIISDEGKLFYNRCLVFLKEFERLLGRSEILPSSAIRIGSFEVFTSYFSGPLLRNYLTGLDIEMRELAPGRLEEALLLNQVDIGITYEPLPRPGIEYIRVCRIEMGIFVRKDSFRSDSILDIPFVVPAKPIDGTPSGVKGEDGWPKEERFRRQTPFRVDVMTTGLEIVHQALCAIFIPRFIASLHNQTISPDFHLEERAPPKGFQTIYREIFIVKRESTPETRSTRQIAKAIRKLCREELK